MKCKRKVFVERNSYLTNLFETPCGKSVYNFLISLLIISALDNAFHALLKVDREILAFEYIRKGFKNIHIAIVISIGILITNILVYLFFYLWAANKFQIIFNCKFLNIFLEKYFKLNRTLNFVKKILNQLLLFLFICYILSGFYFIPILILKYDCGLVASTIICYEQVRQSMKIWAFIRSNVPKVLSFNESKNSEVTIPTFAQFIYFSFSPTLIYQDNYPRTKKRRWSIVLQHFVEVIGCIYGLSLLAAYDFFPKFSNFAEENYTWKTIIILILSNTAQTLILILCLYLIILHSWQNAWAELLQFADREFYSDWWSTESHPEFYRRWNYIVHDFIYLHIFIDLKDYMKMNKASATAISFIMSCIVHEYCNTVAFRIFLPINFTFFLISTIFVIFKMRFNSNLLLLCTFIQGCSLHYSLYSMEYFARINCKTNSDSIRSYLMPRFITCEKFVNI